MAGGGNLWITKESRRELIVNERVDGCSHLNLLF